MIFNRPAMISFLYPVISVWGIALYMHLLHCLHLLRYTDSKATFVLFLPVIILEIFATALFKGNVRLLIPASAKEKVFLLLRLIFWSLLCYFWCIKAPEVAHEEGKLLYWASPHIFEVLKIVYLTQGYVAYICAAIFSALYYIFVYKLRIFRIFISLVLPAVISVCLFMNFYFYGGIGNSSKKEIEQQPGASVFFDKDIWRSMPGFDSRIENDWDLRGSKHSKGVYFDAAENALFAAYGNSYFGEDAYPSILKIDVKDKSLHYFRSKCIHRISFHGPTIIAAPWGEEPVIYELAKKDLHVLRVIPSGEMKSVYLWAPLDVYHDVKDGFMFLGNENEPILAKYDYSSGKLLDYMDLVKDGILGYGGALWNLGVSKTTGNLYFTAGPGKAGLFEVDPVSFKLLRSLKLEDPMCTALLIDDDNQLIYYQCGEHDDIYEINIKDWKVIRTLKGELHSKRLCLDKENNCLYALSFFYGKLIAVDLKSGKHLWEMKVGGKANGLSKDKNILWINSMAGIIKIDLAEVWKNYSLRIVEKNH